MNSVTRRNFLQAAVGAITGTAVSSGVSDDRTVSPSHYYERTGLRLFTNAEAYLEPDAVSHITSRDEMETVLQGISYRLDPVYGLYDVVHKPSVVLERGEGDCIDHTFLAASFIVGVLDSNATIYYLLPDSRLSYTAHTVVSDGTYIYDHHGLLEMSISEYNNHYEFNTAREITLSPDGLDLATHEPELTEHTL